MTIEHRGPFTGEQREWVGDWVFGCDVCQDVCPWNVRFASPATDADLTPGAEGAAPDLTELLTLDAAEFDRRYGRTAFARPGASGMRRNAAAVHENRGRE